MAICEIQTATYLPGGGVQKLSSQIAASPPVYKLIPLTQGKFAIVDTEDFDWLNQWKWCLCTKKKASGDVRYYAARYRRINGKREFILMHREILSLYNGDKRQGDHHNHDGLDNQKVNLRVCTQSQNNQNERPMRGGTSQYKGVCWIVGKRRWRATIEKNQKPYHLGYFRSEHEAALAYNKAAIELFGEFACLNDIPFFR